MIPLNDPRLSPPVETPIGVTAEHEGREEWQSRSFPLEQPLDCKGRWRGEADSFDWGHERLPRSLPRIQHPPGRRIAQTDKDSRDR